MYEDNLAVLIRDKLDDCDAEDGRVQAIVRHPDDNVIDLCCGNGLVTNIIASYCSTIIGVDYSEPLIRIARGYHQPFNARYFQTSVMNLNPKNFGSDCPFDKAYMYEALQHFNEEGLMQLLKIIRKIIKNGAPVYFGSVPDKKHIWLFYNTPERRQEYYRCKAEGREAIGTWWDRNVLESIANAEGYICKFIDHHKILHTAHYRYDVLLKVD